MPFVQYYESKLLYVPENNLIEEKMAYLYILYVIATS